MESIENKMSAGSKDKVNFFTHVFEFNETNKDLMLNMVQYGFLTVIPLVIILKIIKNWFPEEDSLKGSVTILVEVIGQLLFIYAAIWFIHKTITFIPTYSGKAYEDMNKHKEAFYHLDRANKIKNTLINYNFQDEKKLFENIKKLFLNFNYKNIPNHNENKIFIVGMTRSGTSLVEQILSSHNKIYGAGELNFIQNIVTKYFMKSELDFQKLDINNYGEDVFFKSKNYYNNNLKKFKINKKIVVDKAPLNFKWIGLIFKIFPGCKIISCLRVLGHKV